MHLECPAQGTGEAVPPLGLKGHLLFRSLYQACETQQLYLTHRNKHREAVTMRKQRNMAQMKEQNKIQKKN